MVLPDDQHLAKASHANAALVVAHPDDEILWFSSIVDKVGLLIVCFTEVPSRRDWTEGRQLAEKHFPLSNTVFLGLTESETFNGANWSAPVETDYGLEVTARPDTLPGFNAQRYHDNFDLLVRELRVRLGAYSTVFTHNPWGEYGHEEHVQVYRAVEALQPTFGFDLRYSNYCSDRSYHLMLRHVSGFTSDYQTARTNPALAKQIEQIYRDAGCWTWPYDDYTWFTHECFASHNQQPSLLRDVGHTFPLNFVKIGTPPATEQTSWASRLTRGITSRIRDLRSAD